METLKFYTISLKICKEYTCRRSPSGLKTAVHNLWGGRKPYPGMQSPSPDDFGEGDFSRQINWDLAFILHARS
jgi:hypothetical protein